MTTSIRHGVSLTGTLARSEFKLRYAGSALGFFWSFAKPLAMFGILYFAFSYVMKFGDGIDRYPLQLLLAIVLWSFFAEATQTCTTVLVARADLIRKISFPRVTLPLSVVATSGLAMLLNLAAVLLICAVAGTPPTWSWLLLPLLVAEFVVLAIGAGLLLAALYVRFRDIGQIWELGAQMIFYATPIIYPLTLVPEHLRPLIMASPIAAIIQEARRVVIGPTSGTGLEDLDMLARIAPHLVVVAVFVLGIAVFRHAADRVAEHV